MATRKEVNVGTAENGPAKKSKVSRVGERRGANGVNRRKLHRGGLCAAESPLPPPKSGPPNERRARIGPTKGPAEIGFQRSTEL